MNYDEVKMQVDLAAERLRVGATMRMECPSCGERTMSVTRVESNVVAFTCHRASCDVRGYLSRYGYRAPIPTPTEMIHYTGTQEPLTEADLWYFERRFKLTKQTLNNHVWRNEHQQYVFTVRGRHGAVRGQVVRRGAWSDNGRGIASPLPFNVKPKAQSYREYPHGAFCAWYASQSGRPGPVIVVEDCLSALCVAQHGHRAVALLGVHMSDEIAQELQQEGRDVILALDPDATATSLKIARKWGPALPNARVVILKQDLKDDVWQLNEAGL